MLTQFPTARRLPNTRPASKSSAIHVSGRLRAEENADDRPLIAALNSRWRVVVCKNGIQWVLQTRRGTRWHGRCFCRTREGLILCVRERAGEIDGVALVRLLRLPEWIGGAP
jgi:hypothetical protein